MLMLSGIKLPLMWVVRHWCTDCGCCHIEAVVRWVRLKKEPGKMEMVWSDG